MLPDPVSTAPGMFIPVPAMRSGPQSGCCLLLLISSASYRAAVGFVAVIVAALIVGTVALARVVLGVHFASDVLAGITLGIGWVAVTTWSLRRMASLEIGQPIERPTDVGAPSSPSHRADLPVSALEG